MRDFIVKMKKADLISIIIPVFNEEGNIGLLYNKIKRAVSKFRHEIIYVDDGSTDGTYKAIQELKNKDANVKLVKFRKNSGKSAALAAGFKNAAGSVIVTMDGDLQDDPADINKFLEKIDSGYDLVVGWKQNKYKFYSLKFVPSKLFNVLTRMLTGVKLHDIDCPFKAFRSEVTKEITIYGELHRYIPVLAYQKGFKISEVKISNLPRKSGKSKFGFGRVIRGFLDLITVLFLTRFVRRPLHFFGSLGLTLLFLGIILGIVLAVQRFVFEMLIKDYLIISSVLFIILGVQFISLGLIGEMINLYSAEKNN
jgi:glycosyltransferase involved in cell wall biosynthesis